MKRQESLAKQYSEKISPHIDLAKRAYGSAKPGSPQRVASDEYNRLLLEYVKKGGNMKRLSEQMGVPYPTLARRIRVARSNTPPTGNDPFSRRTWGSRDTMAVHDAAASIIKARYVSPDAYREAITAAHQSGVSLYAIASAMEVSYYSLWSAMRS
jgi:lambda repressor-like predicted transcriptional regulator